MTDPVSAFEELELERQLLQSLCEQSDENCENQANCAEHEPAFMTGAIKSALKIHFKNIAEPSVVPAELQEIESSESKKTKSSIAIDTLADMMGKKTKKARLPRALLQKYRKQRKIGPEDFAKIFRGTNNFKSHIKYACPRCAVVCKTAAVLEEHRKYELERRPLAC